MYQIAICEDEEIFAEALEKICNEICDKLKITHITTVFQNSKDFINTFVREPLKFDLLLLDIMMDGLTGMDVAKKIREKNKEATIIFVTSHQDFALQGYEVQALHYLIKPVNPDILEKLIYSDYTDRFHKESIVIEAHPGIVKLPFADIIALETVKRNVAVYLLDKTIYYTGKLSELSAQFPPDIFVRCHQSFVVNIKNVRELHRNNAITINEKAIPVSRCYQKTIQKAFLTHMEN